MVTNVFRCENWRKSNWNVAYQSDLQRDWNCIVNRTWCKIFQEKNKKFEIKFTKINITDHNTVLRDIIGMGLDVFTRHIHLTW